MAIEIQIAVTTGLRDFAFSHSLGQKQPLASGEFGSILLKNSVLRAERKFTKNSIRSCARSPVTVSRSELRQEGFSWVLHYLLISTIRVRRQIANKILLKFKPEFFNRIGQNLPSTKSDDGNISES